MVETDETAIAVAGENTKLDEYLESLLKQPGDSLQLLEESRPFAFPGFVERARDDTQVNIHQEVERFLRFQFAQLEPFGIAFSPLSPKEQRKEAAVVRKIVKSKYDSSLRDQRRVVLEEYERFSNIRETLYTLNTTGDLSPAFPVPISCISDLAVTAPVAFPLNREKRFTNFVCDLNPTFPFANFFQIFNPPSGFRRKTTMKGNEFIPPSLAQILPAAKKGFDQVAIFTPYLNEVWERWPLPKKGMAANAVAPPVTEVDPFLFGFISGSPFMIFLGRWARTSIVPHTDEMIAETIGFLQEHRSELINRIITSATPWYDPTNPHPEVNHWRRTRQLLTHDLRVTITNMVNASMSGKLLPYLRGVLPPSTPK